jgi:hypothetical protein
MSATSKYERYHGQSENPIFGKARLHLPGDNVIAFRPVKASICFQKDHDPSSAGKGAEIIPLSLFRRQRSIRPALASRSKEVTNEGNSRTCEEYNGLMRENILAIGWVGTLIAVGYCMLTIPMH